MVVIKAMIDERPIRCSGCGELTMLVVYDQKNHLYFCQKCVKLVGCEPPYDVHILRKFFGIILHK